MAVAGAAALGAWAAWIEPRRLVVRRRTLRLPGWPAALDGMTVAVVGDLHAGALHVDADRVARITARVQRLEPDLVALVGDFVDHDAPLGDPVGPEAVAARLAALHAPMGVHAVLGNHDWEAGGPAVASALREAGITVLEDRAVPVSRAPAELWVVGLADAGTRDPRPDEALSVVPDGAAVLGLAHDPDVFPRIPPRVALTLSGHTHGGQLALPGLRRRWTPSRFGERYVRGHVVEGDRQLYVTSGVGTSRWPIRLLAPPEIVLLRLRRRAV